MDIAEERPVFDSTSGLSDFHSARQLCLRKPLRCVIYSQVCQLHPTLFGFNQNFPAAIRLLVFKPRVFVWVLSTTSSKVCAT